MNRQIKTKLLFFDTDKICKFSRKPRGNDDAIKGQRVPKLPPDSIREGGQKVPQIPPKKRGGGQKVPGQRVLPPPAKKSK